MIQRTAAIFPRVLGIQPDQTLLLPLSHTLVLTWSEKTHTHTQKNNRPHSYSRQNKGIQSNPSCDEDPLRWETGEKCVLRKKSARVWKKRTASMEGVSEKDREEPMTEWREMRRGGACWRGGTASSSVGRLWKGFKMKRWREKHVFVSTNTRPPWLRKIKKIFFGLFQNVLDLIWEC